MGKKCFVCAQTKDFNTCIGGLHLPKGAIYLKHKTGAYVWVENIHAVKVNPCFDVFILGVNSHAPAKVIVNRFDGLARLFVEYANGVTDDNMIVTYGKYKRDFAGLEPKNKLVTDAYNMLKVFPYRSKKR